MWFLPWGDIWRSKNNPGMLCVFWQDGTNTFQITLFARKQSPSGLWQRQHLLPPQVYVQRESPQASQWHRAMLGPGDLAQMKAWPFMGPTWKPIFCWLSSSPSVLPIGSKCKLLIPASTAVVPAPSAPWTLSGLCPPGCPAPRVSALPSLPGAKHHTVFATPWSIKEVSEAWSHPWPERAVKAYFCAKT